MRDLSRARTKLVCLLMDEESYEESVTRIADIFLDGIIHESARRGGRVERTEQNVGTALEIARETFPLESFRNAGEEALDNMTDEECLKLVEFLEESPLAAKVLDTQRLMTKATLQHEMFQPENVVKHVKEKGREIAAGVVAKSERN